MTAAILDAADVVKLLGSGAGRVEALKGGEASDATAIDEPTLDVQQRDSIANLLGN